MPPLSTIKIGKINRKVLKLTLANIFSCFLVFFVVSSISFTTKGMNDTKGGIDTNGGDFVLFSVFRG